MKSIKINIMGKQYPLRVKDSEVDSMKEIARYVDERFQRYKNDLNKQPETTIMVLAALSITEELFEEAISLPVDIRSQLIDKLLLSLNPAQKDIDEMWAKAAEERVDEIKNGKVKTIPGEQVFNKIKKQ